MATAGVIGLLILAVLAWRLAPAGRAFKVDGTSITVSVATRGLFEDFIPIRGRVVPLTTVYVDTIDGGRVEAVHVEDGATLVAGAALVDLSDTQLQLDVIAREAEVTRELNTLRALELNLERDRLQHARDLVEIDYQIVRLGRQLERRKTLSQKGAVSEAELLNTDDEYSYYLKKREIVRASQASNLRLQQAQLDQLRDATAQLQDNLQFARKNVDGLKVKAAIAGKLTAFNVEVGQSLAPGTRIGQIDDPDRYKVAAEIDEFYLNRVDLGQSASVSTGARSYTLTTAKIYPQVRDGRFSVDLAFADGQPADIRRGQTQQLKLTLGDASDALIIPDGAFYQDTGGSWLFVVSPGGGEAVRRTVRLGRRNARFIEVLDGLEPGERVITSPYTAFLDKDRLIINP
jgi:HlyD family secretion protein